MFALLTVFRMLTSEVIGTVPDFAHIGPSARDGCAQKSKMTATLSSAAKSPLLVTLDGSPPPALG